ncbi:riboflavin biosynthesis protein RibF [Spiroplasma sp. AdecLV25b]|uniref:riboflavin biosynthesis protein RibF n=1 Tax=Spiroplasma sp. AdecLV25b TaxID=3027162 RepID=UPI0027DFE9D0|nr:riboflavin biosynthesis protein RibF [Spiroplasma sp. AdecLV25b]
MKEIKIQISKTQNLKIKNLSFQSLLSSKPLIACWGFFDGIHQGHQTLFNKLITIAKTNNYETCIISFNEKPQSVTDEIANQVLLSKEDKIKRINDFGINYYLEIEFTKELSRTSPQQFIAWLISCGVKSVIINRNVRFGYQGQGTIKTLQQSSLQVYLCDDVFVGNHDKVSSTLVKQLLQNKDIINANLCLAPNEYYITGKVVHGIKEGRTIGFPTANLELNTNYALPGVATYITVTQVDDKWYQSMTVIMMRNNVPLVETYLLNFNQNLYDKVITVKFLTWLRDNLRFSSLDDLKVQLRQDLEDTVDYFKNHS